jgi:hypothetical protein
MNAMIREILAGEGLWILLMILICAAALAAMILYGVMGVAKRELRPVARLFGTKVRIGFPEGAYVPVYYGGVEFRVSATRKSRFSRPKMILRQMTTIGFDLMISEETIYTRRLKGMGIIRDIETGDREFDEKYVVRFSDRVQCMRYLLQPGHLEVIKTLFEKGFTDIRADNKALWITKPSLKNEEMDKEYMLSIMELLLKLGAA